VAVCAPDCAVHSTVRLFLIVDHSNAIAARYTADADRCVVDESKLLRLERLHQQDVQKGSQRLTSESERSCPTAKVSRYPPFMYPYEARC
jgi:hypothetical protein